MTIATRMSRLGTESAFEVLAKARALEAQGREIVHLEIGEPDFETPAHIVEAGVKALQDGYTHYGPTPGLPELRQAVARNSREVRGIDTDWEQVVVTPGAKPIMFYVLLAIAEAGAEVIYPNPGFPIYESMIEFSGARAVPMQLLEDRAYHPDLTQLPNMVNENTRLLIINSPENPCGSAFTLEELETIADVVRSHPDMYVMSDEIYKDILYSGEHHSIAALPGMARRTIILDGFSKSYAMTGWRLGYGIMPPELVPHITRLAVNSVSCAATFSQFAAIAALDGPQDEVQAMAHEFSQRRRLITDGLRSIDGINCPEPEGAFYVFPNVRETGLSSAEFEERALSEAGVAILSGSAFGEYGEGYVRLSYANSQENIARAVESLRAFVQGL
jgi:aspartate/methionine/tyrosine aminotransferase